MEITLMNQKHNTDVLLNSILAEVRTLSDRLALIEKAVLPIGEPNEDTKPIASFESTEAPVRVTGILNMLWADSKPISAGQLAIDFEQVPTLPPTFSLSEDPDQRFRYLWSAAWRLGRNRYAGGDLRAARWAAVPTFNEIDRGSGTLFEIAFIRPSAVFAVSEDADHYWQNPMNAFSRIAGRVPTFTGPAIGRHTVWTPFPHFTNPQNPSDRSKEHPALSAIGWGTYAPDDYAACFRAVNTYARSIGYGYGWPTYHFTEGRMWLGLIPSANVELADVHFGTLAVLGSSADLTPLAELRMPWDYDFVPFPVISPTIGQIAISTDIPTAAGDFNDAASVPLSNFGVQIPVGR